MHLKTSVLGWILNAALLAFASSAICAGFRRAAAMRRFLALGSALAAAGLLWRGWTTGHVPLQNLFEIFIVMAAMVHPAAALSRRALAKPGGGMDPWIGLLALWPAAFVFSEAPRRLPPALQSPLFIPHVAVYLAAYVLMAKAAFLAIGALLKKPTDECEGFIRSAHALCCWGFPLLTLGLLLGAWWGKLVWGDFWHWDPKEMWALATWLIYLGYYHARWLFGRAQARLQAVLLIIGFVAIVLTVSWVNLSRLFPGLHSYAQ